MPGTLFVVATPIGNLEDITARALRVLREVSVIAAEDTRHTSHLLARYGITTRTTSLHQHNERAKSQSLVERLLEGASVALVSDAGTPTVSDPGEQLIKAAIAAGVRVEPVPGPSAALAALSASGLPSGTFTFLGFPPTRSKDRKSWFDALRNAGRTVIFFEAPHRIEATLDDLLRAIGDCDIAVARELTKTHEELVRGPISVVSRRVGTPLGELTVVVDLKGAVTAASESVSASDLFVQFGEMTDIDGLTRRQAISKLARRHHLQAKDVYRAIEEHKKSG